MSETADVTDALIDVVVDELPNDAHPDSVEPERRQRIVEEGRFGSQLPQVDSDDDSVLAPGIGELLGPPPYVRFLFVYYPGELVRVR